MVARDLDTVNDTRTSEHFPQITQISQIPSTYQMTETS